MIRTLLLSLSLIACVPHAVGGQAALDERTADYAQFLAHLQAAFERGDEAAILASIRVPLRVNGATGSQVYDTRAAIAEDFERIFDAGVREAILAQPLDDIFTRDMGAMVGNGEVWFDHSSLDETCSRLGPVLIYAVNHP